MSFLNLFTGAKMSLEFDRLKNKVAVAIATIAHQNKVIADKDVVIADLQTKLAAVPATPGVTDADYAALGQELDTVFSATPLLAPVVDAAAFAPAPAAPTPTILPQADPAHPALAG